MWYCYWNWNMVTVDDSWHKKRTLCSSIGTFYQPAKCIALDDWTISYFGLLVITMKRICASSMMMILRIMMTRILEHLCRNCTGRQIESTRNRAAGSVDDDVKYRKTLSSLQPFLWVRKYLGWSNMKQITQDSGFWKIAINKNRKHWVKRWNQNQSTKCHWAKR